MKTRIPGFRTDSHWGWSKVLYLFQVEVHLFSLYGQLGHILFGTSRMAGYKIRYKLLIEVLLFIDFIKNLFELLKL